MAKRPDEETINLISSKVKAIKKRYAPESIILFGSRARGDHLKDSDIDLLIVSEKFKGVNWRDRIINVFDKWDKKQMLEVVCITPEEFKIKNKQLGIVRQAVKEGIDIKDI